MIRETAVTRHWECVSPRALRNPHVRFNQAHSARPVLSEKPHSEWGKRTAAPPPGGVGWMLTAQLLSAIVLMNTNWAWPAAGPGPVLRKGAGSRHIILCGFSQGPLWLEERGGGVGGGTHRR